MTALAIHASSTTLDNIPLKCKHHGSRVCGLMPTASSREEANLLTRAEQSTVLALSTANPHRTIAFGKTEVMTWPTELQY